MGLLLLWRRSSCLRSCTLLTSQGEHTFQVGGRAATVATRHGRSSHCMIMGQHVPCAGNPHWHVLGGPPWQLQHRSCSIGGEAPPAVEALHVCLSEQPGCCACHSCCHSLLCSQPGTRLVLPLAQMFCLHVWLRVHSVKSEHVQQYSRPRTAHLDCHSLVQ